MHACLDRHSWRHIIPRLPASARAHHHSLLAEDVGYGLFVERVFPMPADETQLGKVYDTLSSPTTSLLFTPWRQYNLICKVTQSCTKAESAGNTKKGTDINTHSYVVPVHTHTCTNAHTRRQIHRNDQGIQVNTLCKRHLLWLLLWATDHIRVNKHSSIVPGVMSAQSCSPVCCRY